MILILPVYNEYGVCPLCWAAATPHNRDQSSPLTRALYADPPYLRVRYCEKREIVGGRIATPLEPGDWLVLDGVSYRVLDAEVRSKDGGDGWVWSFVIEPMTAGQEGATVSA